MVIDTSAVIAILLDEPERAAFAVILLSEKPHVMSVVAFYEAALVMAAKKRSPRAAQLVDNLIADLEIDIAASRMDDVIAVREAYFRYGRRYHPAGLNFADCFSYALAEARDEPRLFKGNDFSKTDVVPAWRP
jgi:ribonuclease VapC